MMALMHPFFFADKHGRSRAARSGRVMLSRSVITSRPLRHPSTHRSSLAGFSRLEAELTAAEVRRRWSRVQVQGSVLCLRMPLALPRVPVRCVLPFCFPAGTGLPQNRSGSACSPDFSGFSRSRTLSAIPVRAYLTRLHHSLYAAACGFG